MSDFDNTDGGPNAETRPHAEPNLSERATSDQNPERDEHDEDEDDPKDGGDSSVGRVEGPPVDAPEPRLPAVASLTADVALAGSGAVASWALRKLGTEPALSDSPARHEWSTTLGTALQQLRLARGVRQQELAEQVGVPRTVVSNWENASRRPNPSHLARLAASLNVPTEQLLAPSTPPGIVRSVLALTGAPDFAATVGKLVPPEEVPLLERFMEQVNWLNARPDISTLTAHRWQVARSVADPFATGVTSLATSNGRTRHAAGQSGRELARALRGRLRLGEGPLPQTDIVAEMCGVSVFRAPFTATSEQQRLRGVLVESDQIGSAALVNSFLLEPFRRLTTIELIGHALLQPRYAQLVLRSPSGPAASNLEAAARGFTQEFLLPGSAVDLHPGAHSQMPAPQERDDDPDGGGHAGEVRADVVAFLTQTAVSYDVPVNLVLHAIGRQLQVTLAERAALAQELNTAKRPARMLRSKVHPGWQVTLEDVPPRFLHRVVQSVLDGRASVQGAARLLGVHVWDLEELLTSYPSATDDLEVESRWADDWNVHVA